MNADRRVQSEIDTCYSIVLRELIDCQDACRNTSSWANSFSGVLMSSFYQNAVGSTMGMLLASSLVVALLYWRDNVQSAILIRKF